MNDRLLKLSVKIQTILMREEGQDLIEYALVVSLIAFAAVATMKTLATDINTVYTAIGNALTRRWLGPGRDTTTTPLFLAGRASHTRRALPCQGKQGPAKPVERTANAAKIVDALLRDAAPDHEGRRSGPNRICFGGFFDRLRSSRHHANAGHRYQHGLH